MTTKRELERLARRAFNGVAPTVRTGVACEVSFAYADGYDVSIQAPSAKEESEMLAAALRGIIAWKEGKK